jgi:large subunit ribosomal protein L15
MQLNTLKRPSSLKRTAQRVGRGQSSGRGKQSGRGGKGQTARAGNKRRPEWRDIIKKLPKRRGYGKNRARTVMAQERVRAVSLSRLEGAFPQGGAISLAVLRERGLVGRTEARAVIVGTGTTSKKFSVQGVRVTRSARTAIEGSGGTIE